MAPLDFTVVGWHTHNRMFDEISADLRNDGHRVVRHMDRDAFAKAGDPLKDTDILLCVANFPLTRPMLAGAPRLRAIVSAVTGTEGVDFQAAWDCSILVANAQTEENVTGMAEATVLLILGALYDFNGTQELLRKSLPRPDPLRAHQLRGKTIGFVGLGKIGKEVARLLAAWGAPMQYTARRDADLTEENLQSRCRGTSLMALSNKFGWMVLTTGNKSEMAVGYFTIYGDSAGGYAVIKDVFKLQVFALSRRVNERAGREIIPVSVIEKPPSAELRPDQRDDQSLPPYEELDPLLQMYVDGDKTIPEIIAAGFPEDVVRRICRLVDVNEYKRRQCAPGVRVSEKAFGKDRRVPITNGYR